MNGRTIQIALRREGMAFVVSRPQRRASRIVLRLGAMLFLTGATGLNVRAQETNSSSRVDYQAFRIISERNIFNANRSPRSARNSGRRPDRPVRTESFALVGTMSYEKGCFAFFDGSSSQYRQALKPADSIAGYKISDITPNHVKLESNGKQVVMRVGMQMRRQDEGEWVLAERTESSGTSTAASSSGEQTSASSGGEESDVVKRLMRQRELEENPGAKESMAPATPPDEKTSDTKTNASSAGGTDDAAKKLEEKREQELKNEKP